jgi:hypothetical protein
MMTEPKRAVSQSIYEAMKWNHASCPDNGSIMNHDNGLPIDRKLVTHAVCYSQVHVV